MRLPLLDAGGAAIGRLDDIVVIPGRARRAPRVLGFVATSQRRRIFVNAGRIATLDSDGARLRSWDVDLNPFKPKAGEMLDRPRHHRRKVGDETVSDVALRAASDGKQTLVGARQGAPRPAQRAAPAAQLPPGRRRRGARRCSTSAPAPRWPPRPPACATCTPATWPASCVRCRSPSASSWPRRWTTSASPTCSRSCPRPSSCASSRASTSSAWSTCSRRWSTTTSPTCWPRCPASSARASSTRWTTRTPT